MLWFVALGLLNNMPYIILLAVAKTMNEGGTALVYLVNTVPGLLVKWTGPYWFDCWTARQRVAMATGSLLLACGLLAVSVQLLGVALVSVQIGLGEASLLGIAGKWDKLVVDSHCLKAFASGTGLAGLMGYLWKVSLMDVLGWSVEQCLAAMIMLAALYWWCFRQAERTVSTLLHHAVSREDEQELQVLGDGTALQENDTSPLNPEVETDNHPLEISGTVPSTSLATRFHFVWRLWPYTVPLFLVYAAEYACQAGAWTAIGFPVQSLQARADFYTRANWLYQAGSFLARSSGLFLPEIPLSVLWLLPGLQVINLLVFSFIAASPQETTALYEPAWLYMGAFYTGLLGGTVYIHGYLRIRNDFVEPELPLFSACVAEALGVLVADVLGLYLQSCLYAQNGLADQALVSCPVT